LTPASVCALYVGGNTEAPQTLRSGKDTEGSPAVARRGVWYQSSRRGNQSISLSSTVPFLAGHETFTAPSICDERFELFVELMDCCVVF